MVRGSSKKSAKAAKASSSTSFAASSSTGTTTNAPPSPFAPAPATLLPLTKCLAKDHVAIMHVERTSPNDRKQAFIVPIILNLIITMGLAWRLYHAVPLYLEQLITIFGYETSWTVTPKQMGWGDILSTISQRTMLLSIDYALFGLLGRWPWEFLFGDKYGRYMGCAGWKWHVGFNRPREIVVRRGRKWDAPIFLNEDDRQKQGKPGKSWTTEEELDCYNKCSSGLSRSQISKNALSLLDKDWDLDYKSMVEVTELIDQAKLNYEDVDQLVLVPWNGKCYFWYPHRTAAADGGVPVAQERDEKLEEFKKRLVDLDCEDVFYRWIEIIQYETAQPGGFSKARKQEAEQELRKMIRNRKRDDNDFIDSIGGPTNIPGLGAND